MDHAIVLSLNQLAGTSVFSALKTVFFAQYLPYVICGAFLCFVFVKSSFFYKKFFLLMEGLTAGVFARLGVEAIRLFIHRPRPFLADPAIFGLISETSSSFPSGHAAFFFGLAAVVYRHNTKWGFWFFVGAGIIGLARIAAGVHYPSDVLAGALLGVALGLVVNRFFKKDRIFVHASTKTESDR